MPIDFLKRSALLQQALPGLVLLGALLAAAWPQWMGLADLWTNSLVWTHGWLIAAVCLWLLFGNTQSAPAILPLGWLRLLPLAALLPLCVFAQFAYIDLAQQLALPLLGISLAYAMYGLPGVRRYAFPLGYIVFGIPVWDVLTPYLQTITVYVNGEWLSWAGVPVAINGDQISVPVGVFNVEGGCSGSHFLVVALAVSALHSRLWKMSFRRSVVAVSFAVGLALFANWVRVFTVIMRAIATQMQTPLIKDHYWFGWCVFAGALGLYFLVMRYFDPGATDSPRTHTTPAPRSARAYAAVLVPCVALFLIAAVRTECYHRAWSEVNPRIRSAPTFSGVWIGPLLQDAAYRPLFPGAEREVIATYHNDRGLLVWYRASYREQHAGSKLVGYGNSLIPEDWTIVGQGTLEKSKQALYTAPQVSVLATTTQATTGERWRVWSWYVVNGHKVAQPWQARLWLGLQGFTLNKPTQAGIVALAAPCQPDCQSADEQLSRFKAKLDGDRK
jgi:EpsI family protein